MPRDFSHFAFNGVYSILIRVLHIHWQLNTLYENVALYVELLIYSVSNDLEIHSRTFLALSCMILYWNIAQWRLILDWNKPYWHFAHIHYRIQRMTNCRAVKSWEKDQELQDYHSYTYMVSTGLESLEKVKNFESRSGSLQKSQ